MRTLLVSLLAALALVAAGLAPGLGSAATAASAPAGISPQAAPALTATTAKRSAKVKKKRAKARAAKRRHAAEMRRWDRLAHCESTSRWHINSGNGYYGGLQIHPRTWAGFGGKRFAALPHQATRKEQIKVGQRIRHGQGWGAWPACSRKLGLR